MVAERGARRQQLFSGERVMETIASAAEKTACALLRFAIVAYQVIVSPILGKQCRFYPSCSHYALIAIERHGLFKGVFLGACRLMRCNGFFPGGYDPVPEDSAVTHALPGGVKTNVFSKG